jgi:protein-L-isoaspartate(D-aspartate) O-methyltransferase
MRGWMIPPPREPAKTADQLKKERRAKVEWLVRLGYLRSERVKHALLKVPREEFIPRLYRDYAYEEVPLPLPGEQASISCPHSYPLFYEPLGLAEGDGFLEVGSGSGYGAAVAQEVVGKSGLVVSIEIDPVTYEFAQANLHRLGYERIILVRGDGSLGYPPMSPYDKIAITAACGEFPQPLVEQLRIGGRLIGPLRRDAIQRLVLLEKSLAGTETHDLDEVLYVALQGPHGSPAA